MDVRKGMPWYLVNGAMELSWFLAWAMFCSLMTLHRPFPFLETIAAFFLAAFVTQVATGRGWRVVSVLGIQILGFLCAALLLIHGIYCPFDSLLDGGWIALLLDRPRGVAEWLILLMNILLTLILWGLGVALARRPKEYYCVCNRFDLGLAAFFTLFIIKLVARSKGEMLAEDSLSLLFVCPFFLFGLLSIGMAQMQGAASRAFLPGYRGIGVIASFFSAVLLGAGGVLLFFLPGLTAAAQMGYRALEAVGRPLVPVLIAILRFVFGPRDNRPVEATTKFSPFGDLDMIAPETPTWWMALLERVLGWGLWGLMLLVLLFVSAVALYYTVKWLLSRTEGGVRPTASLPVRFDAFLAFLARLWRRISRGLLGYPRAAELYGALVGWAGRSGFPHAGSETPLEFGARLMARFPALKPPIELIVGAYNREVYGMEVLGSQTLAAANAAWRFLRSPLRWPSRFKGWLTGSPEIQSPP